MAHETRGDSGADITSGRDTIVEFKQEAFVAAVYPDRKGYFSDVRDTNMWAFAPFPAYPEYIRRQRRTGTVILAASIGPDGRVAQVDVVKSSGHNDLDQLATKAVRLWRAHKGFAGKRTRIPITFTMR